MRQKANDGIDSKWQDYKSSYIIDRSRNDNRKLRRRNKKLVACEKKLNGGTLQS